MTKTSHLAALTTRLANERGYLAKAKSANEIALRTVWIAQIEKEIAAEEKFLGMGAVEEFTGSDDDLLAELMA
jgi:hypothetical protein